MSCFNRSSLIHCAALVILMTIFTAGCKPKTEKSAAAPGPTPSDSTQQPTVAGADSSAAQAGGQTANAPSQMHPIDLKKYCTAKLTDSLNSPKSVKENNLAALPAGRQTFAEIPFEISGVLQLTGRKIRRWGRDEFPEVISGIKVDKRCQFIHLLHGAGGVDDLEGAPIAKLILHYEDNSAGEIVIANGTHVRDWWGPTNQPLTGANSQLAWTGSNPAAKLFGKKGSSALRVYKTTFENPSPEKVIKTIDYRSLLSNAAPFLLGLTLE
jgi:hypothetical protein